MKKKIAELEQIIKDKNKIEEEKNKNIDEFKKKMDEQIFKYGQLNTELLKITEISKETKTNNSNTGEQNMIELNIKKGFNDLLKCLSQYKEILPFMINKIEMLERENESLKEKKDKINEDIINKNNELFKSKEKEIEDLNNIIEKSKKEKEIIENEKNVITSENNIIKDDIRSLEKYFNYEVNNIIKESEDEKLLSDLLNQLIKARKIISFLLSVN